MPDVKSLSQNLNPNVQSRDLEQFIAKTGNVYEALSIISRRSDQISVALREELINKLEDFATFSETIEEVQENKEQIELSKSYERIANPTIIATDEYLRGKLHFHYKDKEDQLDL